MRRLGDLLIERGLVSEQDYAEAERARQANGGVLAALLRLGAISEEALLEALSDLVGLPILAPDAAPEIEAVRATMRDLPAAPAWFFRNNVIVWRDEAGVLHVAGPGLHDAALQETIEQWREPAVRLHLAKALIIEPLIIALRGEHTRFDQASDAAKLLELAEEAPVIDFVNSVLAEALGQRASDIHFEPFEDRIVVRMRVDGVLSQRRTVSRDIFDAVSSRLKLLSGMNIAERRLPQDGRQTIRVAGRDLDVRVSSLPTTWGESIVVRLLGETQRIPELGELGLSAAQRGVVLDAIGQPNGLILVTGPTGSGKTTSVYRLLSLLNDGVRKILTIEDPVEFDLPGVLQMTVRADIGLDFAAGLRSILRQDPDIIFVGEIRDRETARTAIQAALTGHLVISTVHTNSAFAAASRLIDLGVEPFLLADVLRTLVAQRLVRRLCSYCATPDQAPSQEWRAQDLPSSGQPARWRTAPGCKACNGSGFAGRVGVFEIAAIDPSLREAIRGGASEAELTALAKARGFTSLLENGLITARAGETSLSEIKRILSEAGPP